ncbi:MAG: glycoside hydrolase family 9 protein [Treponema sp.]|nr:glycoside hydrolase family 9 protein [Treponema sp.]
MTPNMMKTLFSINDDLRSQIENTGILHKALPLDFNDSLERLGLSKTVSKQRTLCDMKSGLGWKSEGPGTLSHTGRLTPEGNTSMRMEAPTSWHTWPEDNPEGDYTPFFHQSAVYDTGGQNWRDFNRIRFFIYPDCDGVYAVNIALHYRNEGEIKIPDQYGREGRHEVNLINRKWNECFLEFPELPRDRITMLCFERAVYGREMIMGSTWRFDFGEIILESIDDPELARGWQPKAGKIAYSMSGYETKGKKTAVMRTMGEQPPGFTVEHTNRKSDGGKQAAFTGQAVRITTGDGSFDVLDFTALSEDGEYVIRCGESETRPFTISDGIWGSSIWKALNFVFCERCGTPVAGMHGSCHGDILAKHDGKTLAYCGGWHDAGDLSQQTLQTADVVFALFEMVEKARKTDNQLALRLEEEARWGLDFLLKCRFGDGYYASSAGIVHWSDGYIGTFDDRPARVHNNSFDNLLCAGCYAMAAMTLKDDEPLRDRLTEYARADYTFAIEKFEKDGYAEWPIFWEHSLNTSPAQCMATMSWASSMLYRLTGEESYARKAAEAIEYTLTCQRTEPIRFDMERLHLGEKLHLTNGIKESGICGFFYRDKDINIGHKIIQHYTHQSRDAVFMQALKLLIETQSGHPDKSRWLGAMRLYGEYLKQTAAFSAPWGMLPSGVYHRDEGADNESMTRQHLQAGGEMEEGFRRQWKNGIPLDNEHTLRRFPVWFSFRGNSAVHLSTGKAAAICAGVLNDTCLADIAREQLYWIVGKNPFCQSLMYGEGHNYPEQAVFLPGTMTGQLPVGIQTRDDEDIPYWPQANNATYKEAWLTVAGKWFSLVAELID